MYFVFPIILDSLCVLHLLRQGIHIYHNVNVNDPVLEANLQVFPQHQRI
jgi:hypothetical protein